MIDGDDIMELLETWGVVERKKDDSSKISLSSEFCRHWRYLELSLEKRGPIEREWSEQGVNYRDASLIGTIVKFSGPQGVKREILEMAELAVRTMIEQIPAWPR